MGMGHRVYRVLDPRAPHLRRMAIFLPDQGTKRIRMSARFNGGATVYASAFPPGCSPPFSPLPAARCWKWRYAEAPDPTGPKDRIPVPTIEERRR